MPRAFKTCALLLLSAACLWLNPPRAQAAQPALTITAETDKTTLGLSDSLTLAVTVTSNGADVPEPHLPSLPNFNVYSSGQSNNISIVNGRVFSSQVYSYSLTPRFVGQATIPPITLNAGGRTYQTDAIQITVVPAGRAQQSATRQTKAVRPVRARPARRTSGQQQSQQDALSEEETAFVKASVSNKNPYVNEQVNLTVRFYTAVPLMGNPQYTPPTLHGVLSEDLPPVRTGTETINGRAYNYSEIKSALFGAVSGKADIGPAKVQYQPRTDDMIDPDMPDFFQRFFAQGLSGAQSRETASSPLALEVKPLPEEGKPAAFSGAVGKYSISSSVDVKELKTGEALNLIITVSGTGNLKTIAPPKLPDMPNFRVYDMVTSLNMTKSGDLVQGSKTFKTILIPKASGLLTLPPVQFAYFDPSDSSYHSEETRPLQIKVSQGAPQAQPAVYASSGNPGASVTTLGEDIRYISENKPRSPLSARLQAVNALGRANYIPLALFALSALIVLVRNSGNSDQALLKFRKAYSSAKTPAGAAQKFFAAGQTAQGAAALSEAMNTYLCGKLGCPLGSLRLKEIEERLKNASAQVRPETIERLDKLWQELELLRFAPSQADGARLKQLPDDMLELFRTLDKELRK